MTTHAKPGTRLLLTGGGTGGHVYPLLAIHRLLREAMPVKESLYVGAEGAAESQIVPREKIPLCFVAAAPISGISLKALLRSVFLNVMGTWQALRILLRFRPTLILASGGYVSAPVVFASFLLRPFRRIPLVLHEQNVIPGLMNRVASFLAHAVMVSFPETPYFLWNTRCVCTGYPVRGDFLNPPTPEQGRHLLGLRNHQRLLLVYGGSMGSRSINRALAAIAPELQQSSGLELLVLHSTGLARESYNAWEDSLSRLRRELSGAAEETFADHGLEFKLNDGQFRYRLVPYLHDLPVWLAAADLVLCRAGAGTITEICAAGKAAVVIPKRGLPGDHQEQNATRLAERQGCEVVFEQRGEDGIDTLDTAELSQRIRLLLGDPVRLQALGRTARLQFDSHHGEKILRTIQSVLAGHAPEALTSVEVPPSVQILKQEEQLVEFLRHQPEPSVYRRLYRIRMEDALRSSDWRTANRGIKLAGALRAVDQLPLLRRLFERGNGFMRRNILRAMDHFETSVECFPELLKRSLQDPYFEVRAEAFRVSGKYADFLRGDRLLVEGMKARMNRRFEHFEVRASGLQTLPLFIPLEDYLAIARNYRFSENARIRQAILDGLRSALHAGRLQPCDIEIARAFISEMPVTTSHFSPQFSIRDSFVQLYRALSDRQRSLEDDDHGRNPD